MPTEIERKFLVASEAWRDEVRDSYRIRQGYLARTETCTVRIRHTGERAFITIKGAKADLSRAEYEYDIPPDEAEEMLATLVDGEVIEKLRHHVPHDGHVWEVDEFRSPHPGLVIAEVELETAETEPTLPRWLGREVTHDPRYGNAVLSLNGAGSGDEPG